MKMAKKCISIKMNVDNTEFKQKLNDMEIQIDRIAEKYKKIDRLSFKKRFCENVFEYLNDVWVICLIIFASVYLYEDKMIHAIFCLLLGLVITQTNSKRGNK